MNIGSSTEFIKYKLEIFIVGLFSGRRGRRPLQIRQEQAFVLQIYFSVDIRQEQVPALQFYFSVDIRQERAPAIQLCNYSLKLF